MTQVVSRIGESDAVMTACCLTVALDLILESFSSIKLKHRFKTPPIKQKPHICFQVQLECFTAATRLLDSHQQQLQCVFFSISL